MAGRPGKSSFKRQKGGKLGKAEGPGREAKAGYQAGRSRMRGLAALKSGKLD